MFWNELHFYVCHRLLHTRWLFQHEHVVHHRSLVATPWSTYAFHPVKAALLGSLMVTALAAHDPSIVSVIIYPVMSLAMNCLRHLNYAVFEARPLRKLFAASVRHRQHHGQVKENFGFLISQLDALFRAALRDAPAAVRTC